MNESLYGSLEACKRLLAAGIVIETDCVWCRTGKGWRLHLKSKAGMYKWLEVIPAPSMGEMWRELPEYINTEKGMKFIRLTKNGQDTLVSFDGYGWLRHSINPVDALIDLRIWLEQQKGET